MQHLAKTTSFTISDVICLPESWIWQNEETIGLELESFAAHHNAVGRGRGITVYFKESKFTHVQDITEEKIQLTKISSKDLDIIIVYKSPKGKESELASHLEKMIGLNRTTLVCGEFNMCYIDQRKNKATSFLIKMDFRQLIHEATHIDGGHIDHAYFRSNNNLTVSAELYSPYFTAKDHDALMISVSETTE